MSSNYLILSCPQSSPESGSLPMSWLFASGGQSIRASASVLPVNTQDWFYLGWTGWIFLLSKGLSESSLAPQFESIIFSVLSFLYGSTLTFVHDYWKNQSFDCMLAKWCLCFLILCPDLSQETTSPLESPLALSHYFPGKRSRQLPCPSIGCFLLSLAWWKSDSLAKSHSSQPTLLCVYNYITALYYYNLAGFVSASPLHRLP